MQSTQPHNQAPARKPGYLIRLGLVVIAALVAGGFGAAGCLNRPLCSVTIRDKATGELKEDCRPLTTNLFVDTIKNTSVDKIDLLFMIDNSTSMADKQEVLALAVPDLVGRLVNPICVNEDGSRAGPAPPTGQDCQAPTSREFKPITNIHIGIVTSSLGAHGAPGPNGGAHLCEQTEEVNDHGQLLGSRPRAAGTGYPGANDAFLNWNPNMGAGDLNQLNSQFQTMVRRAGQAGCGLEVQLESIYRFLADPFPPQTIVLQGNPPRAAPQGTDTTIIAQRKAFLRADSLVAVVMLTDENDCSIRDSDQFYYVAVIEGSLPQAATVCGTNPNDPCCYSCGLSPPMGCQPDPKCAGNPPLLPSDDEINLRQIQQKRRFGIDFLYPVKRYVNALTQVTLCSTSLDLDPAGACPARADKSPGLVANPLYQDLSGGGAPPRDPSLVFLAGIIGVPWEDLAVDKTTPELHYKTAGVMSGDGTWDLILGAHNDDSGGDNNGGQPPVNAGDPHMLESVDPRPGLPGPNSGPMADAINGHEWQPAKKNDLQYACIFDKPGGGAGCTTSDCDCFGRQPGENNPLCQDPAGAYQQNQFKAKAYPTLRELQLLHDFGKNSIVASICARDLSNQNDQDFGYRPAVDAIIDRLKEALTVKCLPRKLEVAGDGTVPCSIIEATTNPADATCDPARNRVKPDPKLIEPARQRLAADKACGPNTPIPDCNKYMFCEICSTASTVQNGKCVPKPGPDSCLSVSPDPAAIGYCYIEPEHDPPIGDPALVKPCASNQRQILRLIGDNTPVRGGTVLIACLGAPVKSGTSGTTPPPPMTLPDGAPVP